MGRPAGFGSLATVEGTVALDNTTAVLTLDTAASGARTVTLPAAAPTSAGQVLETTDDFATANTLAWAVVGAGGPFEVAAGVVRVGLFHLRHTRASKTRVCRDFFFETHARDWKKKSELPFPGANMSRGKRGGKRQHDDGGGGKRQRDDGAAGEGARAHNIPTASDAMTLALKGALKNASDAGATFGWLETLPDQRNQVIDEVLRTGYTAHGNDVDYHWVAVDFCPERPRESERDLPSSRQVMERVLAAAIRWASSNGQTYATVQVKSWSVDLVDRCLPPVYRYETMPAEGSQTVNVFIKF